MKKNSKKTNDDDIVCIGPDGPRTAKHEKQRLDDLRKSCEESLKKAVKEDPDNYDAARLQDALDDLAKVSDDNLDAYLILQKPLSILMKQIAFTQDEVNQFKALFNQYTVINENQTEQDDRTRDDWMYKIKGPKGHEIVIWINKMKPLFDKGYYNILWFGGVLEPCQLNFNDFDSMMKKLKEKIDNYE